MTAFIAYSIPGDVVLDLGRLREYKEAVGDLACIPYNQAKSDQSVWWLFPKIGKGGDWPAYNLGKFVFYKQAGELVLNVGLNVERGLGADAVATFESKARATRHLMTPSWRWHRFVADMQGGEVDAALGHIAAAGATAAFDFRAGSVPVGDEHPLPTPTAEIRFDYSAGHLRCVHVPSQRPARSSVVGLEKCRTLRDLGQRFQGLSDPWLWIDLYAGARFPIAAAPDQPDAWRVDQLWRDVLEPLRPWLG